MTTAQPRSRFPFWNIIKVLLAVWLAWFVLSRTDLRQLPELLKNISIPWLLFSIVLYLSLTFLKTFQYYVLIKGKVSYSQLLSVVILQNAVSNFLASGAGIASYLTMLRMEHDVKISRSMVVFVLTKLGDLIVLWLALVFSTFLVRSQITLIRNSVFGLLLAIGIPMAGFFLTMVFRRRFVSFISSVLDWLQLSRIQAIQKGLEILQALSEIEPRKLMGQLITVFFLSLIYCVVSIGWYYSTFMTFNFRAEIPVVVFINVLLQLISYFPIQVFGGLGVAEASSLYFWGIFGVAASVLAPVLIGSRILFYLVNLLPLMYLPVYAISTRSSETYSR